MGGEYSETSDMWMFILIFRYKIEFSVRAALHHEVVPLVNAAQRFTIPSLIFLEIYNFHSLLGFISKSISQIKKCARKR